MIVVLGIWGSHIATVGLPPSCLDLRVFDADLALNHSHPRGAYADSWGLLRATRGLVGTTEAY